MQTTKRVVKPWLMCRSVGALGEPRVHRRIRRLADSLQAIQGLSENGI